MKIFLTVLGLVAAGAISFVLYQQHLTRVQEQSPEGLASAAASVKETTVRNELQDRVGALSEDRCAGPVLRLLSLNRTKPIASDADIPADLHQDLALCIERGVISSYAEDQLKGADLLRFFPGSPS